VCRSAREKPYLRAAPSEYRVDTANGQDNDDAQTRTGELWASYGLLVERSPDGVVPGPLSGMPTIRSEGSFHMKASLVRRAVLARNLVRGQRGRA